MLRAHATTFSSSSQEVSANLRRIAIASFAGSSQKKTKVELKELISQENCRRVHTHTVPDDYHLVLMVHWRRES